MRANFRLNIKAFRENVLKADWMASYISDIAADKARQCGEGYESDIYTGKTRVNASVYPATYTARQDNFKNNTIEKVVFTKIG